MPHEKNDMKLKLVQAEVIYERWYNLQRREQVYDEADVTTACLSPKLSLAWGLEAEGTFQDSNCLKSSLPQRLYFYDG